MVSIGFSSHGYTDFDLRYCMQDTEGYIAEIRRLKEKYRGKIQIYLGVEEDITSLVDHSQFDYVIGSSHYLAWDGRYYPFESNYDYFKNCLDLFQNDVVEMAENYYQNFCSYLAHRRPDIIGHFDVITKFDEIGEPLCSENAQYNKLAEKSILRALESNCIFEVNTGSIARGLRTTVCPNENLLRILKNRDAKIILSSDSHSVDTLTFGFAETKKYLRDLGFRYAYAILDNEFVKYELV